MATNWALGRKTQVKVAWEDAYKTDYDPITTLYKIPFNSLNLSMTQPLNQVATIRDNINPQIPFRGNKNVDGSITVPLDDKAIGFWLATLFGACVDGGSGPSSYTHTFKSSGDPRSYTLDKGYTDIPAYYQYTGCRTTNMSLTLGGDSELTADFGIMGSGENYSASGPFNNGDTTGTVDYSTVSDRFENFEVVITEGGSASTCITEMTLNVEKNIEGAYCIGNSGARSYIADGIAAVTGTINGIFSADTLLAKGRNFTETALEVTITSGSNIMVITIPEVVLEQNTPPIEGPGGIMYSLNYSAYYSNASEATACQIVLTNSVTDYDIPAQS